METLPQKLARLKEERLKTLSSLSPSLKSETLSTIPVPPLNNFNLSPKEIHSIVLNEKQQAAVDLAHSGQSFCLAGAAGTGKTTTTKAIISALLAQNYKTIPFSTKYLGAGAPAIIVTAFTKRATKNAAEHISNPKIHCINYHKLIQFEPVFYDIIDPDTGSVTKTMRFEPRYNSSNPLPRLQTIIIDEAPQFSVDMFLTLSAALPNSVQFILIGDIQQIPPTMGTSIYGQKLLELPSIELTQVYRQALESPIIRFLTDIRSGIPITRNDWKNYTRDSEGNRDDRMRIGVFPAKLSWEDALHQAVGFLRDEFNAGTYNPYEDMVLVPFNVKFGTIELNKEIAYMLDRRENRIVHEVIIGWKKAYYAIGDHVLFNTEDYVITAIEPNPSYYGTEANNPSAFIDRNGAVIDRAAYEKEQLSYGVDVDIDLATASPVSQSPHTNTLDEFVMVQVAKGIEEKTNTASHKITLQSIDDPELPLVTIDSVGDCMKLLLSYSITTHKAQGLQARRVYFFLHKSHSPMHYRELIYTAASRAQKYLTIITDPSILTKGIETQRIPGTTLEEKKEYFRIKHADTQIEEPSDD